MAEVTTSGEQRDYKLGCLPFLIIIIVIIVAIVLAVIIFFNSEVRITGFDLSGIDNLDRLMPGLV